ncbi:hypothetical protein A2880_03320 [Candidatus Peribacteria bacterium RIFCSPHIGHO2_01_FULL_49_38]|nr:MAG: hypothetical protein A2880_03320 [Candidatus Peribacteria bacterium RIFCSPHIGHO2_01_FULL_49_38]
MKPLKAGHRISERDIRTLFSEYISECKYTLRRRPETLRGYEAVFSTFVKLCPGVSLDTLTAKTITQFFERLQTRERIVGRDIVAKGVKDSTIGTYSSKLHSFFTWLVGKGLLAQNPLHGVKREYPAYDDSKTLRKKDIERIRTAIENNSRHLLQAKRDRMILSILLFCGVRKGELLGLHVTDVDLERLILTVRRETSKSKHSRKLPINRELRMHIEDYLEERRRHKYTTPHLIVSLERDSGLTTHGIKHWVDNLKRVSGVKFHLHRFRHAFACAAYTICKDPLAIQLFLGHADLKMTVRYLRSLGVEEFRSTVDSMSFDSFV